MYQFQKYDGMTKNKVSFGQLKTLTIGLFVCLIVSTAYVERVFAEESNAQLSPGLQFMLGASEHYAQVGAAFYVSELYYLDQAGKQHSLKFEDSPNSQARIGLVKLSNENAAQTLALALPAAGQLIKGLGFTLGVPRDLNHGYPLRAEKPLNDATMFWTWQQGYKFLRLDLAGGDKRAALHLGATGCESPAPVRPPQKPCAQPNRVDFVWKFDTARELKNIWNIELNLAYLDEQFDALGDFQMCSGFYANDTFCAAWIESLGLDLERGQCQSSCKHQQLFRMRL